LTLRGIPALSRAASEPDFARLVVVGDRDRRLLLRLDRLDRDLRLPASGRGTKYS